MDSVSGLRHGFVKGPIRVKVLRVWKQYGSFTRSLELIVCGENGIQISVTILPSEILIYENYLHQGFWYDIARFDVSEELGPLTVSDYSKKIVFSRLTRARKYNDGLPGLFLYCRPIYDIRTRGFENGSLIDLMGTVLRMGVLQEPNSDVYEEDLCHVRFELIDARREAPIACIAKGDLARDFVRSYEQNLCESIVCVLRFWKVSEGKGVDGGSVVMQSHFPCSEFAFNPLDEDVREFQEIRSALRGPAYRG